MAKDLLDSDQSSESSVDEKGAEALSQVRLPEPGESFAIDLDSAQLAELLKLLAEHKPQAIVTEDGTLALLFPNGGSIRISGAEGFFGDTPEFAAQILAELNREPSALAGLLESIANGEGSLVPLSDIDRSLTPELFGDAAAQGALAGLPVALNPLSGGNLALSTLGDETPRTGRDDLKRGEQGSKGSVLELQVGDGVEHLTGLGDEDLGRRNGETLYAGQNSRFPGTPLGVGAGLDHLWLLGDSEYLRASSDLTDDLLFDPQQSLQRIEQPPPLPPLAPKFMKFGSVEDTNYSDQIFNPKLTSKTVEDRIIVMDPSVGTAVLNEDGTFDYTPAPGYSGVSVFTYSFTDPRTGRTVTGEATLTVRAVADPASISGAAATPEDVAVATPIDVDLNDPDGSEDIEQVVITGVPAGATLDWNTALPGSIALQPDGSFLVTGSTAEIQALLLSLQVTPPADYHGRITLDVAVTTIERNVAPTLPGYLDRETVHYDYHIDVEAVADDVTATGDHEVTDEDTLVHLDDLAATYGDLTDGSETHTVEIRGVVAGAKITNSTGVEYPFVIALDGSKTYTLDPADLGNVYFLPPLDESGLFDTMTIVAIATEGSNGDQETASAPISVLVNPVADPLTMTAIDQATDEDTPVTFGDDITIVVNDPLTQTVTQVEVSGFPVGTIVTYTPVGGGPDVTVTIGPGDAIVLNGGTEQEIRDALATLTLTPPLHTDNNITLTIAATTEDLGGVTATTGVSMSITVAAVADGPNLSGSASGNEDEPIDLPIITSRIDAVDGSESYDFAEITIPAGITLIYPGTLPNGITVSVVGNVYTFTPGAGTTAAQFESFLANDLQVQAPADSDVNFDVGVKVGTIESTLSGGEVTLLRKDTSITIPVDVHPVNDAPAFSGSSTVNEDGIVNVADQSVTAPVNFGANIGISATDSTDGSEAITRIVVTGLPIGAVVTYTPIGGSSTTFTVTAGTTSITLGGSGETEAQIRTALATLSLVPPLHSDADITLGLAVTKFDQTTTEGEAGVTTTFNGTHTITVAAVADVPTGSGSGAGLEDQDIPVSITVGHADNTDGSETLKNVTITGVPAGLTLTESSAGLGTLTYDAGSGTYTVSGPNDAAIQDVLANLTLVYATGGARLHLDTDFNLSVTVTTIESAAGVGQNALPEASTTFNVPITVTAVADGVTQSGSSVLVEDVAKTIGSDIAYTRIDNDGSESVSKVEVSGFPQGSTVTYTDVGGAPHTVLVGAGGLLVDFSGGTEAQIRTALNSLNVTAPTHIDVNFNLTVAVTTDDNDSSSIVNNYTHAVVVQAVADAPAIDADDISLNEDASATLNIRPDRSADNDGSETLSVRLTVPQDGGSPVGTLTATSTADVTFTVAGGGVYTVAYTGASTDPAVREAALDSFLNGGITFTPRAQWSGVLTGTNGIRVEAISTEAANGYGVELGPNNDAGAGTGGDLDTKVEIATTYIDVTVAAVPDTPVMANASTTVNENNNSNALNDPDLVVLIGSRLGLTIVDTDGSESLSLTLTGFPTNAQAFTHTPLAGVIVTPDIPTGTVTLTGANASNVLTVLNSLRVTLADDDDRNFTVTVNGTSTDTNGVTPASTNFTLTHDVIVRAAADLPTVDRGTATKPAVDEDSPFVSYPVTVTLNDTDGSETLQSVRIDASAGTSGARPVMQFTAPGGATIDTSATGTFVVGGVTFVISNTGSTGRRVQISGGTTAEIQAVVASLEVRPGLDNGEDISVSVRATSVESNPSEASSNGPGVVGSEISLATAATTQTFTIPVNPVPDVPVLTLPPAPTGTEDTSFAIGSITLTAGDPDGSEARHIEIDTSSFPAGTVFTSGGSNVGSVVTPGWTRIPESALSNLQIQAPLNYSGTFTMSIRGVVVDTAGADVITSTTATQTLAIAVTPVADPITTPSASVGVEDLGAVAFGADLANSTTGLRVSDTVVGGPGEGGSETLSRVVLDFPADTATQTYTVTDTSGNPIGTQVGSGSAEIAYDAVNRIYTITSTIITGAADPATLSDAQRAQAETDIRATLATFRVEMGPTHTDLNGTIAVIATALDVKDGIANTRDTSFNHTVRIQAVADTPAVSVVDPVGSVAEDGSNIALTINVGRSADNDGSESLSVRITVPTDGLGPVGTLTGTPPVGVTMTHQGGGVYLITATGATPADQELLLDSFVNGGGLAFDPRTNWSGSLTGTNGLRVEVISTEAASGSELAPGSFGGPDGTSKTETVVDHIDIVVTPNADAPSVKGNGVGVEDTLIPIPMSVTLADKDGSESYIVRITGGVPAGSKIYGAGGAEILAVAGVYTLSPADVSALAILPPEHYSSAGQGDIVLVTVTDVTDNSGATSVTTSFTNNITVEVLGVADVPETRIVSVTANEDEAIGLGAAILSSASGNLNNLLVDADGSEALSFVIGGLPQGIIPTTSNPGGGVIYIGNGTWSVTAAAMETLALPAVPNFSGVNPYAGVTVRAVTQELDGDDASSAQWQVTIDVRPIINDATVDGFSSWSLGATQAEGTNESGGDVSLASAANHSYVDDDGSEAVVSYTFDLSGLIANAGIAAQLATLPGAGTGLDKLVNSYISGTFTYNSAAGTITVLAADIAGVALSGELFLDSNQDFTIPVSALVRDTAVLSSSTVTVDKVENGTFNVDLVGTADTPTAFASSVSGNSGTQMALSLGGDSTDTDVGLGRALSEDIYYVVSVLNPGSAPALGFSDGSGNIVGLDNGDGTWVLTPAELVNLHVFTPGGAVGTANLRLTTIATENDGDVATNTASFDVVVTSTPGGGGTSPLPPEVTIGVNSGNEDGSITLNVDVQPGRDAFGNPDPTNPSVAVMISGIPPGAEVVGARFNPDTGRWVASGAAVNAGLVQIIPPHDFSGVMNVTVEAVATNASLLKATTGATIVPVTVDPVADGVSISASPDAGVEDIAIDLNISLGLSDTDGSEVVGGFVYVLLGEGATLVGTYPTATTTDVTEGSLALGGTYYKVPIADLATLQALPASNWHGTIPVTVRAVSIESADDDDGDKFALGTGNFNVTVTASADAPIVTAGNASGDEDAAILIPGLTAALVDNVTTNGAEVLSVKISGVPDGSRFSVGSNNGDGSWTIPVAALPTLSITPPLNYSGTMTLTLTAIALELSNGSEAQSSVNFTVEVAPKADTVEILAENVSIDGTGTTGLELNVRMSDNTGTSPGENAPEEIQITFTSVPSGVSFMATGGGSFTNPLAGTWVFTGTEAEANAIQAEASATSSGGTYVVSLSAVTIDGASTLASPVTDTFQLTIPNVVAGTVSAETLNGGSGIDLIYGLLGNDILIGGGSNDLLAGGQGADTLTGGAGSDRFQILAGDVGTGIDTITDFTAGPGGDAIDISKLLSGFDPMSSVLDDFVRTSESAGNTTIEIDSDGGGDSFSSVVVLQSVTGLDADTMKTNGNLIV